MSEDQERCHRCGHPRSCHDLNCTFEGAGEICTCIGFSKIAVDPEGTRRLADKFIDDAIRELRQAFSSDEQIRKEILQAVDRAIAKT
jgi:hypothetical protein